MIFFLNIVEMYAEEKAKMNNQRKRLKHVFIDVSAHKFDKMAS